MPVGTWNALSMSDASCYPAMFCFSMTSNADSNDVWAPFAGPGGWNGHFFRPNHEHVWVSLDLLNGADLSVFRSRHAGSREWGDDDGGIPLPFQHLGSGQGNAMHSSAFSKTMEPGLTC